MQTPIKTIFTASALMIFCFGKSFGAMNVAKNSLTGEVMYHQHFKVNGGISDAQALQLVQKWFTDSSSRFNRGTKEDGTMSWNKAYKATLDEAFKNTSPLQSVDASSNWVAGRGLTKYYGGEFSSIGQMYIEYYVIVETHNHEVFVTISHIKYHHFNAFNYAAQEIPNNGGRAFASVNGFEALSSAIGTNRDINNLNEFLTNDLSKLVDDLMAGLNGTNTLRASNQ